jgi:hypothetical protein
MINGKQKSKLESVCIKSIPLRHATNFAFYTNQNEFYYSVISYLKFSLISTVNYMPARWKVSAHHRWNHDQWETKEQVAVSLHQIYTTRQTSNFAFYTNQNEFYYGIFRVLEG